MLGGLLIITDITDIAAVTIYIVTVQAYATLTTQLTKHTYVHILKHLKQLVFMKQWLLLKRKQKEKN